MLKKLKISRLYDLKYSVLSALIQPLKILLIFKLIDIDDSGNFGWIITFISVCYGLSHLGWGDYVAKKIVFRDRGTGNFNFIVIINIIMVGILIFIPILFFFQELTFFSFLLLFADYLFLSLFSHLLKIIRSKGHQRDFFFFLFLKLFWEIILLLTYYYFNNQVDLITPFTIELLIVSVICITIFYKHHLRFEFTGVSKSKIIYLLKRDSAMPTTLGLNILISLAVVNIERILAIEVLSTDVYNKYMFLASFIGMAYSVSTLFKNIFYVEIVKESEKQLENDAFKKINKKIILFSLFAHLLVSIPFFYLLKIFYSEYQITMDNVILLLIITFFVTINTYDMVIYYSKLSRKLLVTKVWVIITAVIFFIVGRIFFNKEVSLNGIIFVTLAVKLMYVISSFFWYRKLQINVLKPSDEKYFNS